MPEHDARARLLCAFGAKLRAAREHRNVSQELAALGRAVRQIREERGMDTGDLAAGAGIDRACLEAVEAGRCDPRYDVLLALADALGVKPSALVVRARGSRSLDPAP